MTLLDNPEEWTEYNSRAWLLGPVDKVLEHREVLINRISLELDISFQHAGYIFYYRSRAGHDYQEECRLVNMIRQGQAGEVQRYLIEEFLNKGL